MAKNKKSPYLTVTVRERKGGFPLVFNNVYDLCHFYSRNTGKDEQWIRMLIEDPDVDKRRKYVNLFRFDVEIHLDV